MTQMTQSRVSKHWRRAVNHPDSGQKYHSKMPWYFELYFHHGILW